MIEKIAYSNYKCLNGHEFGLKKINLFSGYNGRGKSSVLQSILMLSQSVHMDGDIDKLHLNGGMVELGDYIELLSDDQNENIAFAMKLSPEGESQKDVELIYSADIQTDSFIGKLISCKIDGMEQISPIMKRDADSQSQSSGNASGGSPQWLKDHFLDIHYISADRQGPVKYVDRTEKTSVPEVDPHGKNAINILDTYEEYVIPDMLPNCDGKERLPFKKAVSEWIEYIMGDDDNKVEVPDINNGKKKNSVLSLEYRIKDRAYSSYHVGFGYSYVLSIIEAALISKPGSLFLVENPEAHLHPQAQSRLTVLLAKLAANNVQIFVETHSEHIVNGIRLAIMRRSANVTAEDLSIFFFDKDYSIKSLEMKPNGLIPNWPAGFFDQAKNDLAEIIRLGAKLSLG